MNANLVTLIKWLRGEQVDFRAAANAAKHLFDMLWDTFMTNPAPQPMFATDSECSDMELAEQLEQRAGVRGEDSVWSDLLPLIIQILQRLMIRR